MNIINYIKIFFLAIDVLVTESIINDSSKSIYSGRKTELRIQRDKSLDRIKELQQI